MSSQPRGRAVAQGLSGTKPPESLARATAKLNFRNANCRCDIFLNVFGILQQSYLSNCTETKIQNQSCREQQGLQVFLGDLRWDVN